MTENEKKGAAEPGDRPALSCKVCMREIPADVDHTLEGQEYVAHFCGLDCYRAWHDHGEDPPKRPEDGGETEPGD